MHRTLKSSRPSSLASTRKRYVATPAMQEKRMIIQAVKDAEDYASYMKEQSLAPQIRKRESEALKRRVNREKEEKRKYEENKRLMIEHRRQQQEREERNRQARAAQEENRRKRFDEFRTRKFKHEVDPDVKALTDHFRERLQRIERKSQRPSPKSASSSDDEFLDALPPDSPQGLEKLWGNVRRALGRGKTRRHRRSTKKNKKTRRHKKKHNKTHRHKRSNSKRTRRRR